jgi:catechol 2,3-dioxygenase
MTDFVKAAPGYRLPAATRLGRVRLEVADLGRSLQFYEGVLGMRTVSRSDATAMLAAHGDDAVLVELIERRGAQPVPRHGRLGLYHYAILLPSRAALARFAAHLGELGVYAGMSDHGVSEAFYLNDPDGLGIEVYADRPRAEWPVSDGVLGMTLAPIDMPSLLAAADGEQWNGMPAGTVIGHVHLHVGDLDEAAAYFHRAFGLDEVAQLQGALFLSAGGYHHHLGTNVWAGNARRPKAGDARLLEWTVVLPAASDVEAAVRSVESAGYPVESDGTGRVLIDPWDTRFRLTAP